jgi:hypothetical protein
MYLPMTIQNETLTTSLLIYDSACVIEFPDVIKALRLLCMTDMQCRDRARAERNAVPQKQTCLN